MSIRISTMLAAAALVLVTACAPKAPEPIYAQPTYNKYGEAECSSDPTQGTVGAAHSGLPPCCPTGMGVGSDGLVCVPLVPRGDDGGEPTGGGSPVAGRS
ncbi:MAG: hypothetical protein KUG69_12605 [Marinosulfonomonas sp.]|nr:hypothetical protein [Marinosulfonomonas sp.]